jgi:LAO/AO transport system kinase
MIADVRVVISAPGMGDDVQAIKAGILEIADILVVNKADQPLALQTCQQLKAMLGLRDLTRRSVPVLCTDAINRTGVGDLADAVEAVAGRVKQRENRSAVAGRTRHLLAQAVAKAAETHVMQSRTQTIAAIVQGIQEARLSLSEGARQVLNNLGGEGHDG